MLNNTTPKKSSKDKNNGKSKAIVWFYDGNTITFYSRLSKDKISIETGLNTLEAMLKSPNFIGKHKTVVMYENRPNGTQLRKYIDGNRVH